MSYNSETGYYIGYIYCILNSINNKKYIGQTTRTIEKRWNEHIKESKRKNPKYVISRAIKKYGVDNFEIKELCAVYCTNEYDMKHQLNELEILLIDKNNTLIHNGGYNVAIGGANINNPELLKRPVVVYNLEGKELGKFDSITILADYLNTSHGIITKVCNNKKAYNYKDQLVFRWAEDPFGKYPPYNPSLRFNSGHRIINSLDEFDPNYQALASVDLYDAKTLKLVLRFNSTSECAKYLEIDPREVNACCTGRRTILKGYIIRYKTDPIDKYRCIPMKTNGQDRRVNMYTLDNLFICTYNSITSGAKDIGENSKNISKCLHHKISNAYGYKWFFVWDETQPDKDRIIKDEDKGIYENISKAKFLPKPINMYTRDDIYVRTYNTVAEAANNLNISGPHISSCCNGNRKTCGGYKWFHASNPSQPDKSKIIPRE